MNKSATWEAISKESLYALSLKQAHKAARVFQGAICVNCPDRNDEVCTHQPCPLARRIVYQLIDILVEVQVRQN